MKKICISVIVTMILSFFIISTNNLTKAKNEDTNSDEKIVVEILDVDKTEVNTSNIKVEVYNANPVYDNGQLLYYTHELCSIYTNTDNGIIIDRPSELVLV